MSNNDSTQRFIFDKCDIRGEVVTLSDSYQTMLSHNHYPAPIQQLLGEFAAAVTLLSSTLKFDGVITLQARGEGPISLIMTECTHHNNLRGIVRLNPKKSLPDGNLQLSNLLINSALIITIVPKKGKRYQGIVPLDGHNLAQCLEHYFKQSEQLETRVWLEAHQTRAAGFLLQALPLQIAEDIEENKAQWQTAIALASTITRKELLGIEHETLLYRLFHEQSVRLFEPNTIQFSCSCSYDRSATALKSLGKEEVVKLLKQKKIIDIDCQFCNQIYSFDADRVNSLFSKTTLH